MPAKVKKGKNKESQEEPVPAITIATRGKVKADDKQIALVVEQSLLEEEKKRALCQEEQRSLAEALRLSLEEVAEKHDLSPVVSKTGFFDRPDNYIMVNGVKHLSSASYVLPSNPRGHYLPLLFPQNCLLNCPIHLAQKTLMEQALKYSLYFPKVLNHLVRSWKGMLPQPLMLRMGL